MKVVSTVNLPTICSVNRFIRASKLKPKDIINIYRRFDGDETYVVIYWGKEESR